MNQIPLNEKVTNLSGGNKNKSKSISIKNMWWLKKYE